MLEVLLAFRNSFISSTIDLSDITSIIPVIEIVGACINTYNTYTVLVLVLCIPPSISFNDFQLFFDLFSNEYGSFEDAILIIGDFNTPSLTLNLSNKYALTLVLSAICSTSINTIIFQILMVLFLPFYTRTLNDL